MSQPLHNSLSFLKSANASSASLERSPGTRSRSGSFLRAISLHSPHPSSTPNTGSQSPNLSLSRTNTTGSTMSSLSRVASMTDEIAESAFSCNPEDFEIKNPIGYGSSAVVYNATYKPRNMRIAVKMIDLDLFERNQIDELRRETALMALSKHANVLRVYGSFVNGSKLYIATPYLSGGSCLDIMKNGFKDGFEEIIIATILKQALEGLVYLHKNSHIHRDVKAGNLLMDDQGTVLLADFGVSSSLTENNEVRKTFVGTPCWMAPEVMEQSGYDFKADIWSFGITAIELATGHAPFAKFSPMKVLMMTLNHRPPTLDREHTKHKFSRIFKEMIDLCLHKDPNKRPSAEKLLLHPFFKQAKRKDYLVKSVLASVPPLDRRTHKKLAFKQTTIEDTTQWDFDIPDEATVGHKVDPKPSDTGTPVQRHISFGNAVIKNERIDLPSPALSSELEISSPIPVRKSRFVIEEGNLPMDRNENTMSSQRSLSPPSNPSTFYKTESNHSDTASKSYFQSDSLLNANIAPHSNNNDGNWQTTMGLGLGISSLPQQQELLQVKKGRFSVNQSNLPTIRTTNINFDTKNEPSVGQTPILASESPFDTRTPSMSRIASNDSIRGGGERKSRFEVQHMSTPLTPQMSQTGFSRTTSPSVPSSSHEILDQQSKLEPPPSLSREASCRHQRNLSRDSVNSCKISRFSIEKEDSNTAQQATNDLIHPFETVCTPSLNECRKKGRFELTGGMTNAERLDSPQSTLTGGTSSSIQSSLAASSLSMQQQIALAEQLQQHASHSVYGHMEALLKQTDIQKAMLHNLLYGLNSISSNINNFNANCGLSQNIPVSRGRSSSVDSRKVSTASIEEVHGSIEHSTKSTRNEINSTMEHLRQLLQISSREKEKLLKENEALKKEVERLRKQQLSPPISTLNTSPAASILKSPIPPSTPSVFLKAAADTDLDSSKNNTTTVQDNTSSVNTTTNTTDPAE